MTDPVFSPLHILLTAAVCALLAFLLLGWRRRTLRSGPPVLSALVLAALVGLLISGWRFVSNALHLNADFLPGVSISDVGSGILPLVGLLALTPLQSARRNWVVTSALAALIIFVANVVFI